MLPTGSQRPVWYQTGVWRFGLIRAVAVLCIASACSAPDTSTPSANTTAPPAKALLNPAKISRVRGQLPPGYEVADLGGPASPATFWGFKPGWITEPPQCGVLAGPATDESTTRGWSGSGPGGIVH